MTPQMMGKLKVVEARYEQLLTLVSDPSVLSDASAYKTHSKALAEARPLVEKYRAYGQLTDELTQARDLAASGDAEMKALADEEIKGLEPKLTTLEEELRVLLVPRDPNDDRSVVLEMRAGTGGDEAALFAADLFRMYSRYAERQRLEVRHPVEPRHRRGRAQGSDRHDRGQGRLQPAQARERRPSRAARARHRSERPHPHLDGDGRRAARSRRSRHRHRRERSAGRHVLLERPRRPERQHDVLGGPHHAPPHRDRRLAAG